MTHLDLTQLLVLVLVGVGLICVGKYAATPPIANWCFGAGVFCCAAALIVFLFEFFTGAMKFG